MGCSGYRLQNHSNPLDYLGIKSMAIPMFLNHSSIPAVSGPFTEEFSNLFSGYSGLKIFPGTSKDVDAVLVGIVSSPNQRKDTIVARNRKFTGGDLQSSIGTRNPFYLPFNSELVLYVRLVLIRRPEKDLIDVLTGENGELLKSHPKIIFDKKFVVRTMFNRSMDTNTSINDSGVLNFTRNFAYLKNNVRNLAKLSSLKFQEEMINAF
jgi:hypothetical protein